MLIDRPFKPPHRSWLIAVGVLTLAAVVWYVIEAVGASALPGGSSLPGFVFGVLGGVIIFFECFLWVRKKYLRVWRIGTAQWWLRAHIWLGLFCLPLLVLHAGFKYDDTVYLVPRLGGWLSTVLMALLVTVIASGIGGLILQNILPKRLLEDIPGETIYSQMESLTGQLIDEADRLVSTTCALKARRDDDAGPTDTGRTYGVKTVGQVQGMVLEPVVATRAISDTEVLETFYAMQVKPYLNRGVKGSVPLANANQAAILFQDIYQRVPTAAHPAVAELERFCAQRRQWDKQAQLHFWLHSWLWLHFPLSMALLVLMFFHVFVALKYW